MRPIFLLHFLELVWPFPFVANITWTCACVNTFVSVLLYSRFHLNGSEVKALVLVRFISLLSRFNKKNLDTIIAMQYYPQRYAICVARATIERTPDTAHLTPFSVLLGELNALDWYRSDIGGVVIGIVQVFSADTHTRRGLWVHDANSNFHLD